MKDIPTPWWLRIVLILVIACAFGGCAASKAPDWKRAYAIAVEADQVAGAWQLVLEEDEARIVAELRRYGVPVIQALAHKATDPDAPDPAPGLWAWLSVASEVAAVWPDERQRSIAIATLSTLRLSFVVAGVPPDEPGVIVEGEAKGGGP